MYEKPEPVNDPNVPESTEISAAVKPSTLTSPNSHMKYHLLAQLRFICRAQRVTQSIVIVYRQNLPNYDHRSIKIQLTKGAISSANSYYAQTFLLTVHKISAAGIARGTRYPKKFVALSRDQCSTTTTRKFA